MELPMVLAIMDGVELSPLICPCKLLLFPPFAILASWPVSKFAEVYG